MSQLAVERVHEEGEQSASIYGQMKSLAERVRRRAFELFERRGSAHGSDLDDWLQAERELILSPESELVEKEGRFEIRIAVPGFEAKDVTVTALPDALVVSAEASRQSEKKESGFRVSEVGARSLFRRFGLPAPIDVDKVSANLDWGVLKITAPKRAAVRPAATAA